MVDTCETESAVGDADDQQDDHAGGDSSKSNSITSEHSIHSVGVSAASSQVSTAGPHLFALRFMADPFLSPVLAELLIQFHTGCGPESSPYRGTPPPASCGRRSGGVHAPPSPPPAPTAPAQLAQWSAVAGGPGWRRIPQLLTPPQPTADAQHNAQHEQQRDAHELGVSGAGPGPCTGSASLRAAAPGRHEPWRGRSGRHGHRRQQRRISSCGRSPGGPDAAHPAALPNNARRPGGRLRS